METKFEYDLLNYPGLVFSNTNPALLACRAAAHAVEVARPDRCRVLELGCGRGTNLLAQAYIFPESEFIGFDLSASQIEAAQSAAAKINIDNAFFRQADILDLSETELGKFDYIVAHGVYSWVPEDVRKKLLAVFRTCLAERGIGYISFNAYPGCRIRETVWDALRFYTRDIADVHEKLQRSLSLARDIAGSMDGRVPFKPLFAREVESLFEKGPPFVLHDELSPSLQPFYFHEFAHALEENELQFLCSADPLTSFPDNLNESGQKLFKSMGDDVIAQEQILDFIKGRQFRCTLICHKSVNVDRSFPVHLIENFFISADTIPPPIDSNFSDDSNVEFKNPVGSAIVTDEAVLKHTLAILGREWPRQLTFKQLAGRLRAVPEIQVDFDRQLERLKASLIPIYTIGFLRFSVCSTRSCDELPLRPKCSAFVQFQIEDGSSHICALDGLQHSAEDSLLRQVILYANGERDRDQIVGAILQSGYRDEDEGDEFESELPARVDAIIEYLWRASFFLPDDMPR